MNNAKMTSLIDLATPIIATTVIGAWSVRLSHLYTLLRPLDGMRRAMQVQKDRVQIT